MEELDEHRKAHRNRVWIFLLIGWFFLSALFLVLLPHAGGLIAFVLLIGILIGRGLLFRNAKHNRRDGHTFST